MSKDNLHLPKTAFSMKASLPTKEPLILEKWEKNNIHFDRLENYKLTEIKIVKKRWIYIK